ncbi:2,3-bisphosphoglycerate-independent phosphoglycerate mutase [Nitrospinae bacterium AH_259_B05_G02_I21]|nr:2,3-bisphosphoglycerate-independent phosphoglycerate mutase [Nitrospinae bacterium AH_259_B05_G02_I21]
MDLRIIQELAEESDRKILLLVLDGAGGLAVEPGGPTELEAARTPNLDELAAASSCGLMDPVAPGIIPGSGPGHLGLFGYDPFRYLIGRGALSCAGVNFLMEPEDIGLRANFATVDESGAITDRRAGRIETSRCAELCEKLEAAVALEGLQVLVKPEKDYRAAVVLRGKELSAAVTDTDPQRAGVPPLKATPGDDSPEAARTAEAINELTRQALEVLADEGPANAIVLRGAARKPDLPPMQEVFKVNPVAIATYPMYKGLARLVGMEVVEGLEQTEEVFDALNKVIDDYTFFFCHIKEIDSRGEDGDFEAKVRLIEEVDALVARIPREAFGAIAVTADHSTPSTLRTHSWHPVPVLLWSPTCRADGVESFDERACAGGGLGRFRGVDLMPQLLAHAQRLKKYGA